MYLDNDHIKIWLKTKHFVNDLDENDADLLNLCENRIIETFGIKHILYSIIEYASNQTEIGIMKKLYEELKSIKLEYEANNEEEGNLQDVDELDMISYPLISRNNNLNILPDDLLSYLCGYLSRNSIINLKHCSSRMAVICLEEMIKINIGVFNANELLDCDWNEHSGHSLSFVNNMFVQENKLIKYSRYQCHSNVQQHLEKRYNIPTCDQLICSVDNVTKLPYKIVNKYQDIKPRKIEAIISDQLELNNAVEHTFLVKWENEEECTWETRESLKNLRIWKKYQFEKFEQRTNGNDRNNENNRNNRNNRNNTDNSTQITDDFLYNMEEEDDDEAYINDYHGCVEFVLFDKRRIVVLSPNENAKILTNIDNINYMDLNQYRLIFLKYRDLNNCNIDFVQFLLINPLISKKNICDYIENEFICTSNKCNKCYIQMAEKSKQINIISDICIDEKPEILISGDITSFGSIITFQLNSLRLCIRKV